MRPRFSLTAVMYVVFSLLGGGLSIWMHGPQPLVHPNPMLHLAPWEREPLSIGVGLALAFVVIAVSRITVQRFAWARRLHNDLRPAVLGMSNTTVVGLAVLSSLGEELLFRSFLTPWIGVVPQALVFGGVHQMAGRSRWIWVTWAMIVGLAFGVLYAAVGSLVGPIVAHAAINALNLPFLRDHTPS